MSNNSQFTESASKRHLFLAVVALIGMPLLPMLMGWLTYFS